MTIDLDEVKAAPVETGVLEVVRRRWSPRSYAEKPVPSGDLVKIFTAAGWAASSNNEQPWRFLVGRKGDETYAKIFESLVEFNQGWAKTAPLLILSVAKRTFTKNGRPNGYGMHDLGAASAQLSLQATALGLHTHGMGGVDKEKARKLFGIPEDYEVGAAWTLGYLGDPEVLPENLKEMEKAARSRMGLGEFVFAEWETAAEL